MLTVPRTRVTVAPPVALTALSVACSGDGDHRPTIRAAGFNFSESHVLAWIFAIPFEDAGFEDDRQMLPAENIALAIRTQNVNAYGDRFTMLVAAISAQITNEELRELNRQVQVDGVEAEAAASGWLESKGLLAAQD